MNKKVKTIGVQLSVPPGDYTKIKNNPHLMSKVSSDISEFMKHVGESDMFYLVMKTYFNDRKNLHKIIDKDIRKACVHSVIISVLTKQAAMFSDENISDTKIIKIRAKTSVVLKKMRLLLKKENLLKQWDSFCDESGQVFCEEAAKFDESTFNKLDIKNNDNVEIDNHLDTEA